MSMRAIIMSDKVIILFIYFLINTPGNDLIDNTLRTKLRYSSCSLALYTNVEYPPVSESVSAEQIDVFGRHVHR